MTKIDWIECQILSLQAKAKALKKALLFNQGVLPEHSLEDKKQLFIINEQIIELHRIKYELLDQAGEIE